MLDLALRPIKGLPVDPLRHSHVTPKSSPASEKSELQTGSAGKQARVPVLSQFDMRDNGFDTIRLIAAFAVIFSHGFPLTGMAEPLEQLTGQSLGSLAVCVFFMISGYLIPASLVRGSLFRYARKRAQRILPALAAAVLVCALILGPIISSLPLASYFAASGTWVFLGNMIFLPVGFDLPGVFEENPSAAVNGSLWSLKFEVACYVFVPIAMALVQFRKAVVITALIASFALARLTDPNAGGVMYYIHTLAYLYQFYGIGMLFFLFADRIPVSKPAGWIALTLTVLSAFTPFFTECAATFGSYALIVFSYHSPKWFRSVTARGDISYGVYVYAFPIQQLLVPATVGTVIMGVQADWLANALITLPLASAAGVVSWILIEKPAIHWGRKPRPQVSPA